MASSGFGDDIVLPDAGGGVAPGWSSTRRSGGGERVRVLDVFQKLEVDGEALKQRVEIIVVKIE